MPGLNLRRPKGIRDVEEWYVSLSIRQDYIKGVFERQCVIGLANLRRLHEALGDRVLAVLVSGTDFGTQRGPLISRATYLEVFAPFHARVNAWIHDNTRWKCMIHSCGSVIDLLPDFLDAGFDIVNPVQCSAEGMDPSVLKRRFGGRATFWGGGVNTQQTLPCGTPDEVRREVIERLHTFAPGGGYVFNSIHNIQAGTPVENVLAMYEAVREFGRDRSPA